MSYQGKTQIADKKKVLDFYNQYYTRRNIQMLTFYNSEIDMIIDDPSLMNVPIDERMINRAHGVFESMAIKKFSFYSLDLHLERLKESAQKAGIKLPYSIEKMKEIMNDMAKYSYKLLAQNNYTQEELEKINLNMRLWISSGRGDFGIYSVDKSPIFYCATFVNHQLNNKLDILEEGISEYTINQHLFDKIDTAKTVSYIKNCFQADYSKEKGGYQGIKLNDKGQILEQAMANVGYINKFTKEFIVTPNQYIVAGTTLKKVIENYVQPVLVEELKVLNGVREMLYTPEQVINEGCEFISFGGDKVIPITQIDNNYIGDGKRGQICQLIQEWYKTQRVTKDEDPINFDDSNQII